MQKKSIWMLLILMICLSGCRQKEGQREILPASQEHFFYEGTEGVNGLAVDEEGLLYTMKYIPPEDTGPIVWEEGMELPKPYQEIAVYNLDGICLKSEILEVGNGMMLNVVLKDEVLYCVTGKSMWEYNKEVLFAVDTRDWTVRTVAELTGYKRIEYMALIGDYVYVLGECKEERLSKEEMASLDDRAYKYRNYKISRFHITEEHPEPEQMMIDFPVALYRTEQNTLMVYRYSQENGLGFLEFDQEKVTLTERGWRKTENYWENLSGCGEGFLYQRLSDNVFKLFLCYGTFNGQEAQVLPDEVTLSTQVVYQKGFAFLINTTGENCVERICVENVVQENKTLHVLKAEMNQETPFGCGFLTENQVLDVDAFALKVLARDSDFDLFLLNTREGISYNIKKNGAFYPLNEVEGVQEYLDACFPYVKELATDDEGNVWMLPVKPAVFGLVYNREFCEENNVEYSEMDWMDFLNFTAKVKEEDADLIDASFHVLKEQFFAQYLSRYDTFDTEEFRIYARQLREVVQNQGTWTFHFQIWNQLNNPEEDSPVPDFFYEYMVQALGVEKFQDALGDSDAIGIAGVPKLSESIRNVGTITFLAVNPESDNLETTLEYISAFAKYMVTKQDSFLLEDESMYTDTPLIKDAYELYANAEVYFQMDPNVYWHDFTSYLNGEMELEEMIAEIERKYQLYIGE